MLGLNVYPEHDRPADRGVTGLPAARPASKWARKRSVLPALGLVFIIGAGSTGADGQNNGVGQHPLV